MSYHFDSVPLTKLKNAVQGGATNSMMRKVADLVGDLAFGFEEVADENELTARLAWDGTCPG